MKNDFNKHLCNPLSLAVMSQLMKGEFSFQELKFNWQTTDGNLASVLRTLERDKLIRIEKSFLGKKPITLIFPTQEGKIQFERYKTWLKYIFSNGS